MMAETEAKTAGQKLLFNKWDASEVKVTDPSLMRYVTLTSMIIPHTCGKFSRQEFGKSNMMIVERLINRLMQTEKNTGKKQLAIRNRQFRSQRRNSPPEIWRHQRPEIGRHRTHAQGRHGNLLHR